MIGLALVDASLFLPYGLGCSSDECIVNPLADIESAALCASESDKV